MHRMTITIDDDLVQEARLALGASSKSEAIRLALLEAVRRKRLRQAMGHGGQIDLDLDQDKLEELRRSS